MNTSAAAPVLLDSSAPVPLDRPFTRREALTEGVPDRQLAAWVRQGLLLSPIRGVFHAAQLPDDPQLRIACVTAVVPDGAVVVERTAGWLWGAPMVLAPNDHLTVPRVQMYLPPGRRLRNKLSESGERTFLPGEVVELDGIRLTSRLRTTCDLGMQRSRDNAFAGMECMMKVADFDLACLIDFASGPRFKGYRWVRNLRGLVPHVCALSQSPPESVLRLRWIDIPSLPYPEPQIEVAGPFGSFWLDMGLRDLRYAAEYDGRAWHGVDRADHDAERRDYLRREEHWIIDVFTDQDLFGRAQNASERLVQGVLRARRRLGASSWHGQDRSR